jgi:heme/copper-type cytochrome/quinol oxidase subunit 3
MSATATTTVHVAHHFDDAQQQYEAAGLGMWLFLATEILFFGGLSTRRMAGRREHCGAPDQQSHDGARRAGRTDQ